MTTAVMNFNALHPQVRFGDTTTNSSRNRWGRRVGKNLIIAYDSNFWRVYRSFDGKFADGGICFTEMEVAIAWAKWFDKTYGEYIDVWRVYTDVELPGLCRYSIDNGEYWSDYLSSLQNTVIDQWTY